MFGSFLSVSTHGPEKNLSQRGATCFLGQKKLEAADVMKQQLESLKKVSRDQQKDLGGCRNRQPRRNLHFDVPDLVLKDRLAGTYCNWCPGM